MPMQQLFRLMKSDYYKCAIGIIRRDDPGIYLTKVTWPTYCRVFPLESTVVNKIYH